MDSMSDSLSDGRTLRTLKVMDDCKRDGLGIDVDQPLPGERVICCLDQIKEWHGKPAAIRFDSGPEYLSQEITHWPTGIESP